MLRTLDTSEDTDEDDGDTRINRYLLPLLQKTFLYPIVFLHTQYKRAVYDINRVIFLFSLFDIIYRSFHSLAVSKMLETLSIFSSIDSELPLLL